MSQWAIWIVIVSGSAAVLNVVCCMRKKTGRSSGENQLRLFVPSGGKSPYKGLLKKAVSGVLAIFPCSRSTSTDRAQKWLRSCMNGLF